MNENEFYAQILAKMMVEQGLSVSLGGETEGINIFIEGQAPQTLLLELARERCCAALREIREILDRDDLTDRDCFRRIEEIVCLYERLGPGGASRHDFG